MAPRRALSSMVYVLRTGLAEYDGMDGIACDWQSVDGALAKVPLAIECVGAIGEKDASEVH